jgi:hypothetical protein
VVVAEAPFGPARPTSARIPSAVWTACRCTAMIHRPISSSSLRNRVDQRRVVRVGGRHGTPLPTRRFPRRQPCPWKSFASVCHDAFLAASTAAAVLAFGYVALDGDGLCLDGVLEILHELGPEPGISIEAINVTLLVDVRNRL